MAFDHIVIFNERHLRRVLSSYVDYYHRSLTHLSLDQDCPDPRPIQRRGSGKIVALPQSSAWARQDLHDTLGEVGAKLESVGDNLRPVHLVENHAIGASLIAGALGFIIGSTSNPIAGAVITAALFGFALSRRSAADGDKADVRTESLNQR
jgi:hypothetical protein